MKRTIRTLLTAAPLAAPPPARTTGLRPDRQTVGAGLLIAATALAIFLAERRWPQRERTEPGPRRVARNLALGATSMAVVALIQTPLTEPLARTAERRRWGVVQRLKVPAAAGDALAFLLMDYSIYLWHRATHRNPFLWRFHLVHHLDVDLDSTTALRFHAADMAISVPYRLLQVGLIGTSPRALGIWQTWFFLSVLFHHSNLKLPPALDGPLSRLVTTPHMHAIHHSATREDTDANWSSGLALWDHLHGTFRAQRSQEAPTGVPAYRSAREIGLVRSLALPFTRQRDAWRLASPPQLH